MVREPYPKNGFHLFRQQLHLFAHICGVTKDPDVAMAIDFLDEAIVRKVAKTMAKGNKGKDDEAYKFYAIFKKRYLELTDFEYLGGFDGKDVKIVSAMSDKLEEHGATVEEYCHWLFDDFFPKNDGRVSPNINIARSDKILGEFFYRNRSKIKKRVERKKAEEKEAGFLFRMRVLYREVRDEEIMQIVANYRDGKINLPEFEKIVELLEKKHKK